MKVVPVQSEPARPKCLVSGRSGFSAGHRAQSALSALSMAEMVEYTDTDRERAEGA